MLEGSVPELANVVGIGPRQLAQMLSLATQDLRAKRLDDADDVLSVLTTLSPLNIEAWELVAKLYRLRGWNERASVIEEFCNTLKE